MKVLFAKFCVLPPVKAILVLDRSHSRLLLLAVGRIPGQIPRGPPRAFVLIHRAKVEGRQKVDVGQAGFGQAFQVGRTRSLLQNVKRVFGIAWYWGDLDVLLASLSAPQSNSHRRRSLSRPGLSGKNPDNIQTDSLGDGLGWKACDLVIHTQSHSHMTEECEGGSSQLGS
jgi:hypothetical protein